MPVNLATVAHANAVMATFRGNDGITFRVRRGRIYIACPGVTSEEAEYQLRPGDRAWPTFRYGRFGMGGTTAMATAQLVRWCRGMTRRGRKCWSYWVSDTVGLGSIDTLVLLGQYGYFDDKMNACVGCGAPEPTDWYSLGGVTGPMCRMHECRKAVPA